MNPLSTRILSLLAFVLLSVSTVMAQSSVTGNIKDGTGEDLIGVSVLVKGTAIGTISDFEGNYSINFPGDAATLVFSYIGFSDQEIEVTSSTGKLDVVLSDESTVLDEVVVTGFATNVKRSNLANSVASISADKLTGITVQSTMDGALYGKFKGAEIRSNSGAPGGGMSVKLRGVTSIFGDQQPLYIVDGIYVNNSSISLGTNIVSAAAGGGNTATNQDDASNRIADIDPEDIESIEILKGASAAAIYGSRAAGGVVLITTKKGKAGKTRVSLGQTIGFSSPTRLLGTRDWDAQKIRDFYFAEPDDETEEERQSRIEAADAEVAKFNANGITDYEAELYDRTATSYNTRLNISGGTDKTSFFIGGTYKDVEGIVENTGYEKAAVRVNVGHKFTNWLDLYVTNNFINAQSDRGFFNNGNTNTTVGYALAFTQPWEDLFPDENGNYPANPEVGSNVLETVALITNREKTNRYLGSATATARLFQNDNNNLKLVLRGGLDQYTHRTTGLFPQELSFFRDPNSLRGVSISGSSVNTNRNLAAFLVHTLFAESGLSFRTQVGITQEDFNLNTVISTATGINGSQTNVDQATNLQPFQNRIIQQDKGFFAQEEVNYDDKIIATVGLRADKSSNNGDANKLYYYPKANIAFNLHEFDFWTVSAVNQFKLRAAFGQSGRFSNFDDRFNVFQGTLIDGNSGIFNTILRGNPDVEPERQSEIEFGADFGFLNNKINLDITYYIKEIDDLLLQANVETSSGYTRRVINGGALRNNGLEIGLSATPVTGDFSWNTGVNFWTNTSEVTRLDVPAFNLGGFAASLGQYRIEEGKSATQIVGTYDPESCATGDCSDLDPDGDGFRVYGDAEPDFNMSWFNGLSYKGLELNFLWHWKQGGDGVNLSTLLWDLAGLTWDYDDVDLDPAGAQGNGDYRTSQWFAGNAGPWIEDAGYIRLREVGLYYTIPRSVFNEAMALKLGVSGRNLINIFDYNSYDPEVSNFGGNVLANTIEVTPFPTAKTFNFHVNLYF